MTRRTRQRGSARLGSRGACRPGAARTSAAASDTHLQALPDGRSRAVRSRRRSAFPAIRETIAFVNAVAAIAQREDHHPDLSVHYDHCTVTWSTHSAGGVTMNDIICAAQVDELRP